METKTFSDDLKGVLRAARDVARNRGDRYVGTEHYLLALLSQSSSPTAVFMRGLGLDRKKCEQSLANVAVTQTPPRPPSDLPYTRGAMGLLPLAEKVARDVVGTGHLLVALATTDEGPTRLVLIKFGATADRIRAAIQDGQL